MGWFSNMAAMVLAYTTFSYYKAYHVEQAKNQALQNLQQHNETDKLIGQCFEMSSSTLPKFKSMVEQAVEAAKKNDKSLLDKISANVAEPKYIRELSLREITCLIPVLVQNGLNKDVEALMNNPAFTKKLTTSAVATGFCDKVGENYAYLLAASTNKPARAQGCGDACAVFKGSKRLIQLMEPGLRYGILSLYAEIIQKTSDPAMLDNFTQVYNEYKKLFSDIPSKAEGLRYSLAYNSMILDGIKLHNKLGGDYEQLTANVIIEEQQNGLQHKIPHLVVPQI